MTTSAGTSTPTWVSPVRTGGRTAATAYIAKLLNRNNIPVIVGMVTPFGDSQEQARDIVEDEGEFVLVYLNCSVDAAQERDPKGLYGPARAKSEKFTGIDHPFQEPLHPESSSIPNRIQSRLGSSR